MAWLTNTKTGAHFNTDWIDQDAKQKEQDIARQSASASQASGKSVTKEDIKKHFVYDYMATSYTDNPTYQKTSQQATNSFQRMNALKEKRQAVEKEMESQKTEKPQEQWTTDDRINAMLGERPVSYTDRGLELKEQYDRLYNEERDVEKEWTSAADKIRQWDREEANIQKEIYTTTVDDDRISKQSQTDYVGFKTAETSTPYIDEMIKDGRAKVVEMSPEKYMREVSYNIFDRSTMENVLRGTNTENVNKYMQQMREGTKFDTPYLNYRDSQQEGRHRAIAAAMLGIKKIPVVVVTRR